MLTHNDYKNTIDKQRRSLKTAEKDISCLKKQNEVLNQRLGIVTHHKSVFPPGSFHGHFFEVAPELRFFDREAKKVEISQRPRRKDTWGKHLSNVRSERGIHLHREINRDVDFNCQQDPPRFTARFNGESDNEDEESQPFTLSKPSVLRHSQLQWAKITGVPANPIPVLANDKNLAYRDGTRVCRRLQAIYSFHLLTSSRTPKAACPALKRSIRSDVM